MTLCINDKAEAETRNLMSQSDTPCQNLTSVQF
jgi:hypothetical protein